MTEPERERDERGRILAPQDREQALRDQLEKPFPPPWQPEAGESIVGAFARLEQGYARGKPAAIIVLADRATGEETSVWLLSKALKDKIAKSDAQLGELIAIKYEGKVTPKGGGDPYNQYRVAVDRDSSRQIDWSRMPGGDSDDVEPPSQPASPTGAAPSSGNGDGSTAPPAPAQGLEEPCVGCGQVGWHQPGCSRDIPY